MKSNKEKNLLDLEYNTYVNHFNILALFIGTTYITVVVGTFEKIEWTLSSVISTAILTFLLIILIWLIFYSKLKETKNKIKNL